MKLAIPALNGKLFPHFGKCSQIAVIEVDTTTRTIESTQIIAAPPHEPGRLPLWLKSHGVTVLLTGGIGARAAELCTSNGIQVLAGAPVESVENIVTAWLRGTLKLSANVCNHDEHQHHEHDGHHECGEHHHA